MNSQHERYSFKKPKTCASTTKPRLTSEIQYFYFTFIYIFVKNNFKILDYLDFNRINPIGDDQGQRQPDEQNNRNESVFQWN